MATDVKQSAAGQIIDETRVAILPPRGLFHTSQRLCENISLFTTESLLHKRCGVCSKKVLWVLCTLYQDSSRNSFAAFSNSNAAKEFLEEAQSFKPKSFLSQIVLD